jgi:transposase
VQRRFRRWACQGIWDELFLDGIPTNALGTVMLDSSACKAQRYASGARGGGEEALGRSRGGLTTKIHAVVDDLGRPLCFLLTPGQAADCRQARALLEGLSFERLIGDRGYDTDELRDWIEELGAEAVIPHDRAATGNGTWWRTCSAGSKTSHGSSYASARPRAATPASSASPSPS